MNNMDYWKALAENYDLPCELLREMYEIWDKEDADSFSDFVESLKEDAKESVA